MNKLFAEHKISKSRFLAVIIFSLLILCSAKTTSAQEDTEDEFPWVIFYPAFINKSIDIDNDGFTVRQGDCNDNDGNVYPGANEICGDGVDQDCDGNDLICPPPCADIAGDWYITEDLSVICCLDGDCESDTLSGGDSVTIEQDGCNVSYDRYVPGYGTFTRTGTIDGNNIYFSGIFLLPISGCTATQNVVDIYGTVDGDQIDGTGTGSARGTCDGASFSCTGESTVTGTRLSSLFTPNALTDTEFDRKPSATFSQSGRILLFIVP